VDQKIQFFSEDFEYTPKNKGKLRLWLTAVIKAEKKNPWYINFIFCSDEYLLELNRNYLDHNTLTDIITFPYMDEKENISGDIYISIPRVVENAEHYGQDTEDELYRVMVHGILHLLGYKDKSVIEKTEMTAKENFYLSLIPAIFF
jgi:rRNA maturation RNase YbeY